MYKNKKNSIVGIIITIVILILLVAFTNAGSKISYIENICNIFVMPIQNGFTYLKNKMGGQLFYLASGEVIDI